MGRHSKTRLIIEEAQRILSIHSPMTVRQLYYQLVSRQVIKNNRSQYQAVSKAIVDARQERFIPWEWIEDRQRRPRTVNMWNGLAEFGRTVMRSYRRNVWKTQAQYIEVWLEKDALSGIFEDVLFQYGVTLCVGRGYDGWSSIHEAAERYCVQDEVTVLYFGDFDPSGDDMVRSLTERLNFFNCRPEIIKCALNLEDISRYNLPSDFAKASDTRSKAFIAKYGNVAVELDALPVNVLKGRLIREVEKRLDLRAFNEAKILEKKELSKLRSILIDIEATA